MRVGGDDAGCAREPLQDQFVAVLLAAGFQGAHHLGAAGQEPDVGGVGAVSECGGQGVGGVRGAPQAQDPGAAAESAVVGQTEDAQVGGGAQAAVAPGDGLVGDAEHVGDLGEGRASVDSQCLQELQVDGVE